MPLGCIIPLLACGFAMSYGQTVTDACYSDCLGQQVSSVSTYFDCYALTPTPDWNCYCRASSFTDYFNLCAAASCGSAYTSVSNIIATTCNGYAPFISTFSSPDPATVTIVQPAATPSSPIVLVSAPNDPTTPTPQPTSTNDPIPASGPDNSTPVTGTDPTASAEGIDTAPSPASDTPVANTSSNSEALDIGVGVGVGGFGLLATAIIAFFVFRARRKAKQGSAGIPNSPVYTEPPDTGRLSELPASEKPQELAAGDYR